MDKAVYRIEQELKRTKRETAHQQDEKNESQAHLEHLLQEVDSLRAQNARASSTGSDPHELPPPHLPGPDPIYHQNHPQTPISISRESVPQHEHTGNFAFDDAENPLQLLARASDLSLPTNPLTSTSNSLLTSIPTTSVPYTAKEDRLRTFFGPFRPRLDIGEDIDPVDMGYITLDEADVLFT